MIKRCIVLVLTLTNLVFCPLDYLKAAEEDAEELSDIEETDDTELISLDIKEMEIRDVLKILSQKSGLNIIADNEVRGKVQIYVNDVEVMQALDIIVSTNSLAYDQEGTLIRVMTDRKYRALYGKEFKENTATEIIKLDHASASNVAKSLTLIKSDIGKVVPDDRSNTIVLIDNMASIDLMKKAVREMDTPLATQIFPLEYAKADKIKEKLDQVVSKDVGSVRFDERTNKLVVEDTPGRLEEIKKIVEAFDEKTKEVSIEAHIIQVSLADKYSHGINWYDIADKGRLHLTMDTNTSSGLTNVTPSTFTLFTSPGDFTSILSLLDTYGKTKVLSKPMITVMNKQEAKILVGSKEAYVTSEVTTTEGGTYHTTDNVQFVDVGVSLIVTPEINRAGFVTLKIKPEVSSSDSTKTVELKNPDGSTRTIVPYVTTAQTETQVVVKDNATLIIGGLMKDTIIDNEQRVPFLSDIPLIGKLFNTVGKSKEKTELVVFITPHIIEGDKTTKEVQAYDENFDKSLESDRIERPGFFDERLNQGTAPISSKPIWHSVKAGPRQARPEELNKISTPPKKILSRSGSIPEKPLEEKNVKVAEPKKKQIWTPLFGMKNTETKPEALENTDAVIPFSKVSSPGPALSSTASPQKAPHEEYNRIVNEEIERIAKENNTEALKGTVELQFTLDKFGFLVKGPVVLNKPDLSLVRLGVSAVKNASPFPPFTGSMKKDEEEFYVVLVCE